MAINFGDPIERDGSYGYMTMQNNRLAWTDERLIDPDVRPWRPFRKAVPFRNGTPVPESLEDGEEFFANSHYLVFRRKVWGPSGEEDDYLIHLSLRTVENDARHDWREMQRVKNELTSPQFEGVELYPAIERLVDTANQYHLWVFPFRMGFGFSDSLVLDHGHVEATGGSQRPFAAQESR